MADNSQTITLAGGVAQQVTSSGPFSDTIVIENNAGAGIVLYARTDGIAAVVGANGTVAIEPGATAELDNTLTLPNWNTVPNKDLSESYGLTAQSGFTNADYAGVPNYVSVIPATTATGQVTVTFQ